MDVNSISPSAKRAGSPLPESNLQKRATKNDETTKSDSQVGDLATDSSINQSQQFNLGVTTKEQQWVDQEIKKPAKSAQGVLFSIARGKHLKGKSIEKVIKALEAKGADINATDNDGRTALHVAAKHGQIEAIKALVEYGAEIDMLNKDEWTALGIASESGHVEAVKELIKYGADIEAEAFVSPFYLGVDRKDIQILLFEMGLNIYIHYEDENSSKINQIISDFKFFGGNENVNNNPALKEYFTLIKLESGDKKLVSELTSYIRQVETVESSQVENIVNNLKTMIDGYYNSNKAFYDNIMEHRSKWKIIRKLYNNEELNNDEQEFKNRNSNEIRDFWVANMPNSVFKFMPAIVKYNQKSNELLAKKAIEIPQEMNEYLDKKAYMILPVILNKWLTINELPNLVINKDLKNEVLGLPSDNLDPKCKNILANERRYYESSKASHKPTLEQVVNAYKRYKESHLPAPATAA